MLATFGEWTGNVILTGVQHPSGIPARIVEKVVARRGRLHAFETIEPRSTALVVIDLDVATVGRDNAAQVMIPVVNWLACALRDSGGTVAWVKSRMDALPRHFAAILGAELAEQYVNEGHGDGPGTMLWHELQPKESDVFAVKSGASAFFPGKCNLKEQLDLTGIDTILVVGAVTNVCCESSARDAAELGYKVILVSDALAGHAHGLHEATLATFYRIFGDVRPSREILALLESRSAQG
jgi:nicotinamidase-related amidase